MVAIDILLDMLMYKPSLGSLFVGLLGVWEAGCMTITMTDIRPIVTRGSSCRLFALCMGVAMVPMIL